MAPYSPVPRGGLNGPSRGGPPDRSCYPAVGRRAPGIYLPSVAMAGLTACWSRGASELAHYGVLGSSLTAALASWWARSCCPSFRGGPRSASASGRLERRPLLARGHLQDAAFFVLLRCRHRAPRDPARRRVRRPCWRRTHRGSSSPFTAILAPLAGVGVTLVAMDACNWLAHYADHRYRLLWRFHAVHHTQEELSVLTTFRTHPLVHTLSFLTATVPVVAIMPDHSLAPDPGHRLPLPRRAAACQRALDVWAGRQALVQPRLPPAFTTPSTAPTTSTSGSCSPSGTSSPGVPSSRPAGRPRRPHRARRPADRRRAVRSPATGPARVLSAQLAEPFCARGRSSSSI